MYVIAQVHTFHWVYGYDFAGWRIRLRWVEDSTSLGDGFDFAGWKSQFRWLNEALDVAEWSGWSCRMKYLNKAIDVAEFSTISLLNFSMRFKNGLKAQKLLAQGIALGIIANSKAPCKGKSFVNIWSLWSFCPYRATGLRPWLPRAMPWARSFCPLQGVWGKTCESPASLYLFL